VTEPNEFDEFWLREERQLRYWRITTRMTPLWRSRSPQP
jgi:hypothetical protein